jgi:hypothetical protein
MAGKMICVALRVGSMPVAPAWSDSGIEFSLHWLVVSFFALSFLFQVRRCKLKACTRRGYTLLNFGLFRLELAVG